MKAQGGAAGADVGFLVRRIGAALEGGFRIMEVCGTHTHSIFRHGLRSMLPEGLELISGPGCPVCVTSQADVDRFILLASLPDTLVATFGDMVRVPGRSGSLQEARARGADVRVVYSPAEALEFARQMPDRRVVFLAVGFETTAPVVAAVIRQAASEGVDNFFVAPAHKRMVPALDALLSLEGMELDALLLPGHVSSIIGADAYQELAEQYRLPMVVAGFEAVDILTAILAALEMGRDCEWGVVNCYPRAVTGEGNQRALDVMEEVFESCGAEWRGLGLIPGSGLGLRGGYRGFDIFEVVDVEAADVPPVSGCRCGEVIVGRIRPQECALFMTRCTPDAPVGPCMVSSEGTCSAHAHWGSGADGAETY